MIYLRVKLYNIRLEILKIYMIYNYKFYIFKVIKLLNILEKTNIFTN